MYLMTFAKNYNMFSRLNSRTITVALLVCGFALFTSTELRAAFTLTSEGINVTLKGLDDIRFQYPKLLRGQEELGKIVESRPDAARRNVVVKYDNGAEVRLEKKSETLLELRITNPPAGLTTFRFEALVPFAMNEGGGFRTNQEAVKPFPMTKPERPHLFQGNVSEFSLIAPNGETFGIKNLPVGSYLQIQDNREWNWAIFAVMFLAPYNPDHAVVPYEFSFESTGGGTKKMVDRFGQDFSHEFAARIKSEEELKEDARTEQAYYAALPKANRDTYGGIPGTGAALGLTKTGFFHVEKKGERWFLVNPEGNAFFHLGICCFNPSDDFTYTENREEIFEWLPPRTGEFSTAWHSDSWWNARAFSFYVANYIRKFGKPYNQEEWSERMIDRVRAMGFTSGGCFSAIPAAFKKKNFPHVRSFGFWNLGFDIPGARGFFDPFNPELAKKVDDIFARTIAPHADDPLLIGYYLANEQGAEDLPKALAALDGSFYAKRELVGFLKKKYPSIAAFNDAWKTDADSFDALAQQGLPITTESATKDMAEFVGLFLDKYYSLLNETFRKYDKNHMLLGSRWMPQTADDEILVRTCAKYCEVISINYYTKKIDSEYLERLHRWSGGKPFLLSEWHFSCTPETGLPGGLGSVQTQRERGLAYRSYVEQAATTDYIVGVEWFTLVDQARSGRFFEQNTGERANTGIFAVTDRPWKDFVAEVVKTNVQIEDLLLRRVPPFRFDVP